jgi:transmembrane sensor
MGHPRGGAAAGDAGGTPRVTREVAAEAALWVARLHGPSRSREMELQCLEWQARSAAHRHAFERCTETWMEVPNAARAAGFSTGGGGGPATDERWRGGGASVSAAGCCCSPAWPWCRSRWGWC